MASATLNAPKHGTLAPATTGRREYECRRCGHVLEVFGLGHHRIYFEPANLRLDDPIMNGLCPECGLGLPGKV
jgi:rubredoxin